MKIKNLISNSILFFLVLILVIAVIGCISELRYYHDDYYREEENILYVIQEKDYPRLVEICALNRVLEEEESVKMKTFYAVADYYEASTYYKAYEKIGDHIKAAEQKEIMEEAKKHMAEFQYLSEDILKELEQRIR